MLKSLADADIAAHPGLGRREGALGRLWAIAALLIGALSLAPLLICETPAVLDYPNHLARFFVLAHPRDPLLAGMYAPHWAILPNLGMDVLGIWLASALPIHVAGRILLGLALLAPPAGAAIYARAAFGRWTWWSLGVGVVAFNAVFILGFMNFLLGLGLALAGAAAWRLWRASERPVMAAIGGLLLGLAVFFCHLAAFAYFAVLISADEAEALLRMQTNGVLAWRRVLSTAAALAVALGPTLALYALTHTAGDGSNPLAWRWRLKLVQALTPFMAYDEAVTLITACVLGPLAILVWRHSRRARGLALALAAIGALYLVTPFAVAGGAFVDTRLPLMAVLLLFAGLDPRLPRGAGRAIAAAFALLIVGRCADVAWNWQGRNRDLAELRATLAQVEPGARILAAGTAYATSPPAGSGRVLPKMMRLDEHLGALAVIERRAFWPLLFADPSQQPLVVRPPYAGIALPSGFVAPWRMLVRDGGLAARTDAFRRLAGWRARYDYVLLLGPRPADGAAPRGLGLVRAGEAFSLYRVVRPR